jgi:hypothetical protein
MGVLLGNLYRVNVGLWTPLGHYEHRCTELRAASSLMAEDYARQEFGVCDILRSTRL